MRYRVHSAALVDTEYDRILEAMADATARVSAGYLDVTVEDHFRGVCWRPLSLRLCASVLLVLALAGCTTTWTRPGSTLAEFQRDSYECRYAGAALPYAPPPPPTMYPQNWHSGGGQAMIGGQLAALSASLADSAARIGMIESCMVARGWEKD